VDGVDGANRRRVAASVDLAPVAQRDAVGWFLPGVGILEDNLKEDAISSHDGLPLGAASHGDLAMVKAQWAIITVGRGSKEKSRQEMRQSKGNNSCENEIFVERRSEWQVMSGWRGSAMFSRSRPRLANVALPAAVCAQ
jgi:hypothetical protein